VKQIGLGLIAGDGKEPVAEASVLLAWLSLFIQVPESQLTSLWPADDLTPLLDELEGSGRIQRGGSTPNAQIGLADAERAGQRAEATDRWGAEAIRDAHRNAVTFWLAADDPCSAAFHLEQLGESDRAIELVTAGWQRALFLVGHDQFCRVVQRLDRGPRHPEHLTLLAIQRLMRSLPWPAANDPRLDLQLLNVAPEVLDALQPHARILVTAAIILSLTSAGQLSRAIELGEDLAAAIPRMELEGAAWEYLSFLWNALAEAYVTAGWPKKATFHAANAESFARSLDQPFPHFRALALQSTALALNGEYGRSAEFSIRAQAISDAEGWGLTEAHFPLILSDMLIASARLDHVSLTRSAKTLDETFPDNRLWTTTALVARAMAHLCRNEVQEGVTLIRRVLNGSDEWGLLGIVRGFALGIHADLLLAANSAGETLALLANGQSSLGHALCFDMQRSNAYLLLGQPEKVLQATDACIAMGEEHCLRTLPPVLFRRAVAYEQLNLPDAADQAFHQGYLLIRESQSLTPLLNVSPTALRRLWTRLRKDHPEYGPDIDGILRRADQLPGGVPRSSDESSFTRREIQLATMLRSGADAAEIANELFLSPNTVKVHLRNLYRKLGAHSRAEALAKIESIGLHILKA
jgi:DNA-binding CsgD family transcriptional regulator